MQKEKKRKKQSKKKESKKKKKKQRKKEQKQKSTPEKEKASSTIPSFTRLRDEQKFAPGKSTNPAKPLNLASSSPASTRCPLLPS